MLVIWTILFLFFLLLSVHPFVTYPLSLLPFRRRRPKTAMPETLPTFAICVCAYNEEATIAEKARNMIAVADTTHDCELFVYVDGASDRTAERLAPFSDRITVVVSDVRRGKSHGMNVLVERCRAEIIVFTDANVELDGNVLWELAPSFADPEVGCVCGHLIYSNPDESAMSSSGSLYWRIEEAIKQIESDAYSVIGADGSLFAIRRSAHHPVPDDIIDDFYVSMKIVIDGLRVARAPDALAFERSATSTADEFRRKIRIACQAFNVHRLIWPEIWRRPALAYCYVSHRLLKWLIGYNLLLSGLFLLLALLTAFPPVPVFSAVIIVALAFAALLALKVRMAQQVLAMLMSFAGTSWGVWRSVQGEKFQTWTPTPSARATGHR
ncbi:MAG: glycosyltransferase [Alphaproteobacteria bacterium]|nr:glycosyltransferase [Alphaproteobacteria bacterium]MBU0804865.1 glycosyltransferase [Alphaproteobacteria bacterium]MBU0871812.1 glycosyltransferase [Alphaproteobacteria bacterium]MBU1403565.1 glycosyltransferase [Alphaproteobacteria bacterium]MBU1591541.1 glycosyltransferase [Alphaproteobacteria bacterium]